MYKKVGAKGQKVQIFVQKLQQFNTAKGGGKFSSDFSMTHTLLHEQSIIFTSEEFSPFPLPQKLEQKI